MFEKLRGFKAAEEGLETTVEWHLENLDWVDSVVTGEYQQYYEKVYGKD